VAPASLPLNAFALGGVWDEAGERGTARRDASIELEFQAQRVYVVLGPPPGRSAHVRVLLDGRPIPAALAGDDVHGGALTVDRQRLYDVVALPRPGHARLSLRIDPGISAYAFTFG
jgi:hypothetical protein